MVEISEVKQKLIVEICRKYGVKILLLFGSQISGGVHKESDIDLAFAGKKLSFGELAEFNTDLQSVFQNERIDTVSLFSLNPLILKRIFENHEILFLEDRFLYHNLASYAVKSYIETKFLRENLKKQLEEKYVRN